MTIHKTIRLERTKTRIEIDVRIERQDAREGQLDTNLELVNGGVNRLSISLGQWIRKAGGSWREDCFGQCRDALLDYAQHSKQPERADLERLVELWDKWHLNDMAAGTEAQNEAIAAAKAAGELQDGDWYDMARIALAARGLLTDRGHEFGKKWLVKRLPPGVVTEVLAICERLGA